MVGFDADPEGGDATRRGAPRQIGVTAISTVARHLRGEKVPREIAIDTRIVDAAALRSAK